MTPIKFSQTELIQIAMVTHAANRTYCLSLGDTSQQPWELAPAWQHESAVLGVKAALTGMTPEQLHQSWMDQKLQEGWVYGEVKDANAKTHPCIVAYDQLPEPQRVKDRLFRAIVATMREAIEQGKTSSRS